MYDKLAKLAARLDQLGLKKEADKLDELLVIEAEKVKARNRPSPIFQSTHPKVKDNKDHFPIDTIERARNALARVHQKDVGHDWWSGSKEELIKAVEKAVHSAYPSIGKEKA